MAQYEFLTTWCLDAPIARVFDVLRQSRRYPEWWRGVVSVVALAPGDADGIGEESRMTWRSALPYELTFDSRITRIERPHLIEGTARGELEGIGTSGACSRAGARPPSTSGASAPRAAG